ncbi:Protein of unknown function [Bacillus mobilis]|nr:Protein of unknown function [Bacillus mobilis]
MKDHSGVVASSIGLR